jgi:glycosyltransferase involved in cell wall biosynthesis
MYVSIVIPSRNRRELVSKTIRSLRNVFAPEPGFEIIVADHGSTDNTIEAVRRLNNTVSFVDVPYERASVSAPRNAGAHAARGELIIFLDSGMICHPNFIQAHIAAHAASRHPRYVAGGIIGAACEDPSDPYFKSIDNDTHASMPVPSHLDDERRIYWNESELSRWRLMWGANTSILRSRYLAVGGSDEEMTGWGFEDVELAFRLSQEGTELAYAYSAWAAHYPHTRSWETRTNTARTNGLQAYLRHHSPKIETWPVCNAYEDTDCQVRLADISWHADEAQRWQELSAYAFPNSKRIFYGFAPAEDADQDSTFIIPPGKRRSSPSNIESHGLRTWLPDSKFEVAIASPYLLRLDWKPGDTRESLACWVLRELGRLAPVVRVVLDASVGQESRSRLIALARQAGLKDFAFYEVV